MSFSKEHRRISAQLRRAQKGEMPKWLHGYLAAALTTAEACRRDAITSGTGTQRGKVAAAKATEYLLGAGRLLCSYEHREPIPLEPRRMTRPRGL